MSHLALYRKYRSQTFSDLVGQDHVVRILQNAISRGTIGHAYLFTGPRGTGKTSTARLLAKALNCEKGPLPEPCNECQACREITIGNCMDVLEMDAASESGVDDVRGSIVEVADYRPAYCRYKVFIIDEVHDLSRQAFDALLKTIEEPPDHLVFVLATTEFNKVPPTIRSRCQRFEFHRGTVQDLVARLKYVVDAEGVDAEPAALTAIARMSDGGFRDSLTLLEQAVLTTEGQVTLQHIYDQLGLVADETVDQILNAMALRDVPQLMASLEDVYRLGRDPRALLESVLYRMSDLTRAAYGVDIGGLGDSAQEAALKATAGSIGLEKVLAFRAAMAEAHRDIRDVSIPRVWLEAELIRIAHGREEVRATHRQESKEPDRTTTTRQAAPPPVNIKAEPSAVARPADEVLKSEQAPVPVNSGDPELDRMRQIWRETYRELAGTAKVVEARLANCDVSSFDGKVATIRFARQVDLDYVMDRVKAQAAIRESWARHGGNGVELQFVMAVKSGPTARAAVEATAVELPAEGERLVDLVHEVFETRGRNSE